MDTVRQKTCPDCFKGILESGKCNRCGFEIQHEKQNSLRIETFSKLKQRYIVGRILGYGGFGITYKVYDTKQDRICAVKEFIPMGLVARRSQGTQIYVTSSAYEGDFEHGKKRFIEEARVLMQLDHIPEVVKITDYFEENNTAYFVMDYIEGATLKQLMRVYGGTIPLKNALEIIKQAGEALEQVHTGAGIFHRDISADNLMLTKDGNVKIIDFGNAKYLIGKNSQTLSVVLKHGYAPPEQYSSTSLQGSYTDVYALAVTLYYILTGVMVTSAPDRLTGEEYWALNRVLPEVPEYVSKAVDRALELNSKKRTQTVRQFLTELGLSEQASVSKKKKQETPYIAVIGTDSRRRFNLPCNSIMTIGRSKTMADIVPARDSQISKKHCEIFYDSIEQQFYLVDQSTNGTYLDGQRMEKGKVYVIRAGERFSLGRNLCILQTGVEK